MPMYDYRRPDGTVFESRRTYGCHLQAYDDMGVVGDLVWLTPPQVNVPVWHQSAPNESPRTVDTAKKAADPRSRVRPYEAGMEKDAKRIQGYKTEKAQLSIDRAVGATLQEYDLPTGTGLPTHGDKTCQNW